MDGIIGQSRHTPRSIQISLHLALEREGHLEAVLHIFAYLKKYHNTDIVFDPSDPMIDQDAFKRKDWTSSELVHIDGKEDLPPSMPEPRGLGFIINAKVDAYHAADTVTKRYRTGFIVYLNCAPENWFSKKQNEL